MNEKELIARLVKKHNSCYESGATSLCRYTYVGDKIVYLFITDLKDMINYGDIIEISTLSVLIDMMIPPLRDEKEL